MINNKLQNTFICKILYITYFTLKKSFKALIFNLKLRGVWNIIPHQGRFQNFKKIYSRDFSSMQETACSFMFIFRVEINQKKTESKKGIFVQNKKKFKISSFIHIYNNLVFLGRLK